jgi:hypothetical protein
MDLNKIGCECVVWIQVAVTSFRAVLNVLQNCWGHKNGNFLGQLSISYFSKEDYSIKLASNLGSSSRHGL